MEQLSKPFPYKVEDIGEAKSLSLMTHYDNTLGFKDFVESRIASFKAMNGGVYIKSFDDLVSHLRKFGKTDGKLNGWLMWKAENKSITIRNSEGGQFTPVILKMTPEQLAQAQKNARERTW